MESVKKKLPRFLSRQYYLQREGKQEISDQMFSHVHSKRILKERLCVKQTLFDSVMIRWKSYFTRYCQSFDKKIDKTTFYLI